LDFRFRSEIGLPRALNLRLAANAVCAAGPNSCMVARLLRRRRFSTAVSWRHCMHDGANVSGKMRILHVISTLSPETGGPAVAVIGMAKAVAALGHDVAIHTTDHRMPSPAVPAEQTVDSGRLRIIVHRHLPLGPIALQASYGLWRALCEDIRRVDVVHLHSLYLFHDWITWRECRRAA